MTLGSLTTRITTRFMSSVDSIRTFLSLLRRKSTILRRTPGAWERPCQIPPVVISQPQCFILVTAKSMLWVGSMESPSVSKARPGSMTRLPTRGTRRGRRSPSRWVAQVTALLVSSLIWLVTGTAAWHRPIITSMTLWPIPGLQWRPCRCLSTGLLRLALARKNSWLVGATRTFEAQPRSKSVLQLR
jgi:hypothetical protein